MLDVLGVTDKYAVFAPITVDHAFIHKLPVLLFTNPSPMLAVRVAENPYWVLPVYAVNLHCPLVPAAVEMTCVHQKNISEFEYKTEVKINMTCAARAYFLFIPRG